MPLSIVIENYKILNNNYKNIVNYFAYKNKDIILEIIISLQIKV